MAPAGYRHPTALVESDDIGKGTRIWAFAHVMKGAAIGSNCNIGDHCFVEAGATIGDDVTIKNGVAIWEHVTVENSVFLGPGVVLTNDKYPRSRAKEWTPVRTRIERGATVGANATIICGNDIGQYALVGAGAVVTRSVPAYGLATGNPATIIGHVCRCGARLPRRRRRVTCTKCGLGFRCEGRHVRPIESTEGRPGGR